MRTPTALAVLLTLAPVAACQSAKPDVEPTKSAGLEVLPNIPLPPGGMPLTSQSSSDAMQVFAATEVAVDSVLAYYRSVLAEAPYRLVNETTSDSLSTFYVEQDGPSMWITVQKNGASGTMVVIAGAATDTSAAAKAARKRGAATAADPTAKKPN
jgi:hypothetical protein